MGHWQGYIHKPRHNQRENGNREAHNWTGKTIPAKYFAIGPIGTCFVKIKLDALDRLERYFSIYGTGVGHRESTED